MMEQYSNSTATNPNEEFPDQEQDIPAMMDTGITSIIIISLFCGILCCICLSLCVARFDFFSKTKKLLGRGEKVTHNNLQDDGGSSDSKSDLVYCWDSENDDKSSSDESNPRVR